MEVVSLQKRRQNGSIARGYNQFTYDYIIIYISLHIAIQLVSVCRGDWRKSQQESRIWAGFEYFVYQYAILLPTLVIAPEQPLLQRARARGWRQQFITSLAAERGAASCLSAI